MTMTSSKRKRDSDGANATSGQAQEEVHKNTEATRPSTSNGDETLSSKMAPLECDNNNFRITWTKNRPSHPLKRRKLSKDTTEPKEDPGIEGAKGLGGWFTVKPASVWTDLNKYRNFVVNPRAAEEEYDPAKHKFQIDDFIFVNHQTEAQEGVVSSDERLNWVAKVREVRAASPDAVYVRVVWMYWPEELPSGKQVYHGDQELVASNLIDIIDAMTVDGKAKVVHLPQAASDKQRFATYGHLEPNTYYWRQTFNPHTSKLSSLPRDCVCKQVSNLDEPMYRCPNAECAKWLHKRCLEEAATRQYRAGISASDVEEFVHPRHKPGLDGSNTDGDNEESELRDTIFTSPRSQKTKEAKGFFGFLKDSFGGSANATKEVNGKPRPSQTTLPTRGGKGKKITKAASARVEKEEKANGSGDYELVAELILQDGRFTGRARILRADASERAVKEDDDEKEEVQTNGRGKKGEEEEETAVDQRRGVLVHTFNMLCPNDKCGKSMVDTAADADAVPSVDNANNAATTASVTAAKDRPGFDAVKDALQSTEKESDAVNGS